MADGTGVQDVAFGDRVALLSDHAFAQHDVASAKAVVALPPALAERDVPRTRPDGLVTVVTP